MGARGWSLVLLSTAVLAVSACGDDGGGDSEPAADAMPHIQLDGKCSAAHPYRRENTGRLAGLYLICVSADQSSLELLNTSSTMLRVRPKGSRGSRPPAMKAVSPVAQTPRDAAVNAVVQTDCTGSHGPCHVSPNGLMIAYGDEPVDVHVGLAWERSAAAASISWVVGSVTAKLQTPGQRLAGRVTNCAKSFVDLMKPKQFVEDKVAEAIDARISCKGLLQSFVGETGPRRARPERAAKDMFRLGRRLFASDLGRDLSVLATIRLLTKLRP